MRNVVLQVMSSSEDEVRLPVAESEVRREVSSVIARDGVDNLKSKAVREHLKNTFNVDFSSYKSQVFHQLFMTISRRTSTTD